MFILCFLKLWMCLIVFLLIHDFWSVCIYIYMWICVPCINLHGAGWSSLCPFLQDVAMSFKWVEGFPMSDWSEMVSCLASWWSGCRITQCIMWCCLQVGWLGRRFSSTTCCLCVRVDLCWVQESWLALGWTYRRDFLDSDSGSAHPLFTHQVTYVCVTNIYVMSIYVMKIMPLDPIWCNWFDLQEPRVIHRLNSTYALKYIA